jgi:hypothetical protein
LDKRPKLRKMDMRFGTWNVRSLYRASSLMTVAKGLTKHKLDLVGIQGVRWDRGCTEPADSHNILNRWKNYFSQLLKVHRVNDIKQKYIKLSR